MLIDDLSSGGMPDLYTAVSGECGDADLTSHHRTQLKFQSKIFKFGKIYGEYVALYASIHSFCEACRDGKARMKEVMDTRSSLHSVWKLYKDDPKMEKF